MPALIPKAESDSSGKGERKPKRERHVEEGEEKESKPRRTKSKNLQTMISQEGMIMPQFVLPTLPDYAKEIDELRRELAELRGILETKSPLVVDKDVAEFTQLALNIAYKYARTKKRWFLSGKPDPKLQNTGLDPSNKEQDKRDFERLLQIAKLMNV
jgi:hypothetical protein